MVFGVTLGSGWVISVRKQSGKRGIGEVAGARRKVECCMDTGILSDDLMMLCRLTNGLGGR